MSAISKRKWRCGPKITSLDELAKQKMIFWLNKPLSAGWFMSWQFRMTAQAIAKGLTIHYAIPAALESRFSDEEILRAERRLGTEPTLEGRMALAQFLNDMDDTGSGNVDDVIDKYWTGLLKE